MFLYQSKLCRKQMRKKEKCPLKIDNNDKYDIIDYIKIGKPIFLCIHLYKYLYNNPIWSF